MSRLIGIAVIALLVFGGWKLAEYYQRVEAERAYEMRHGGPRALPPAPALAGLPPALEPSLIEAESRGASALHQWLEYYGPSVQDPRKASIELDYCVMIARDDPAAARQLFDAVRQRIKPDSPLRPRIEAMAGAYQ
jgi:hypothetical protein